MADNLVSVIMSIYNEPVDWVDASINSILNQTYRNIEFIIVLDNPERIDIKDYLNSIVDSRVVIEYNEKNLGLIESLNKAIKLSNGIYIARMDADDVSHRTRIEEQLLFLKNNKLDLVGCFINIVDSNLNYICSLPKIVTHKYIVKLLKRGVISIVHPTFFGKAEVFKRCYYNNKALYAEDMEILCNAVSKGYQLGNFEKILFDCRYNEGSITKKNTNSMDYTVDAIAKSFNEFYSTGKYCFQILPFDETSSNSDVKNHLLDVRKFLSQKQYLSMCISFFKALFNNPKSLKRSFFNAFNKFIYMAIEKFMRNII